MTQATRLDHEDFFANHAYPTFHRFYEVGNRLLDAIEALTLNAGKAKRSTTLSSGLSA